MNLLLWCALALAGPRLAVADMANRTGDSSLDGAGAGLSGVLVSKLVQVDDLEVVERAELAKVVGELQLGKDGLVDPTTAAKAGKLLGATHMVLGDLASIKLPTLAVNLRVVEVQTGKVVAATDVVGQIGANGEEFFVLVDQAAFELVELLQVKLGAKDRIELGQVAVNRLGTVDAYGRALKALDRGDRKDAEAQLQKALGLEPSFKLAEEALSRIAAEVVTARQGYAHSAITSAHAAWDELESRLTRELPASPTIEEVAYAAVRARMRLVRGDLAGFVKLETARAAATTDALARQEGKFNEAVRALVTDGYTANRTMYGLDLWPWKVRLDVAEALLRLGRRDEAWALALEVHQHPGPTFSVTSGPGNPTRWAEAHGYADLAVIGHRQVLHRLQLLGYDDDAVRQVKVLDEAVRHAREARERRAAWDALQSSLKAGRADTRRVDEEERALRALEDDVGLIPTAYAAFQARVRAGHYDDVRKTSDFRDLATRYKSLADGAWRDAWYADQRLAILLDHQAAVPSRDAEDDARRQKALDDFATGAYAR